MTNSYTTPQSLAVRVRRRAKLLLGPWGVFLEGFIKYPAMVGSIVPTSHFTMNKMLAPVDWESCQVFVEYGPGVGTFCRLVLGRLRRDATLLVIDTNEIYIKHLMRTIADSRFVAVHGSAADVAAIVRAHGHTQVDYVLSGVPFSTLPAGMGPAIVEETWRVLRPGGAFMVYQFTARARHFMAHHFARIDHGFALWNVLPCKLFWGWKT